MKFRKVDGMTMRCNRCQGHNADFKVIKIKIFWFKFDVVLCQSCIADMYWHLKKGV
jgi:protein-arginine kinase activator protein McsA